MIPADQLDQTLRAALAAEPWHSESVPTCPTSAVLSRADEIRRGRARRAIGRLAAGSLMAAVLGVSGLAAASPAVANTLHVAGLRLQVLEELPGGTKLATDDRGFQYKVYPLYPDGMQVVEGQAREVTLQQAQADVGFPVIAPRGLPDGATLVSIVENAPVDPQMVTFRYHTASGGEFAIVEGPDVGATAQPVRCEGGRQAAPALSEGGAAMTTRERPAAGAAACGTGTEPHPWVVGTTQITVLNTGALTAAQEEAILTAMSRP